MRPAARSADDVATALPSNVIVQVSNGFTQVNASGPPPSTAGLPDVDLDNLGEVTSRVFASLQRFSVHQSFDTPRDPTFVGVDQRRRDALLRAVAASSPDWSDAEQRVTAGLLDVLWNLPSYERLVGTCGLDGADASRAVNWHMTKVIDAIEDYDPPPA